LSVQRLRQSGANKQDRAQYQRMKAGGRPRFETANKKAIAAAPMARDRRAVVVARAL